MATLQSNRGRIRKCLRCKVSSCERRAEVHLEVDVAAECWRSKSESLRQVGTIVCVNYFTLTLI